MAAVSLPSDPLPGTRGILGGRPLVRSSSPTVIREAVDGLTREHHVLRLRGRRELAGAVDGLALGPLGIVHVAYGAPVLVDSPPSGRQVVVVLPLGPMEVESNGHRWVAREPFALSSCHSTAMSPDLERGALVGSVPADAVEAHLESLLARPLGAPLELSSERPLRLASPTLVQSAWFEACRVLGATAEPDDVTQRALLSSLMSTMAMGLAPHLGPTVASPHAVGMADPGPRYVREAQRVMEAHLGEDLRVEDLAAAVRISPRQLHAAFAEHVGMPPAQYLRRLRLERARSLLLDAAAGGRTVASVAARVGFSHLGRFAAYYTERFGEPPSATLRRTGPSGS
ncbi:helix-turn-helix transcriptional regulator [Sinomonas flava]|uniref:HTH araC/xylS-type domain-containing protein n=1 Tax=Sinomonas flava TaxID=496857 RepID=A0ABP5NNJ6_9MICC